MQLGTTPSQTLSHALSKNRHRLASALLRFIGCRTVGFTTSPQAVYCNIEKHKKKLAQYIITRTVRRLG